MVALLARRGSLGLFGRFHRGLGRTAHGDRRDHRLGRRDGDGRTRGHARLLRPRRRRALKAEPGPEQQRHQQGQRHQRRRHRDKERAPPRRRLALPLPRRLTERREVGAGGRLHRRVQGGHAGAAALRDLRQQLAQRLQPFEDLAHRRALRAILGQQQVDQRQQRRRHPGGPPAKRQRRLELVLGHQVGHGLTDERRLAAEHLVEHAAERVHVRPIIDQARPAALLG